ncbi:MAG: DUF1540 domain-containing protein [Enterocloster sp.]
MTRLECSVKNCVHNADRCCCRRGITVDGQDAREAESTCCASFEENRGGVFTNLFKTPETKLEVGCDALNCVYNEDRCCRAEKIDICGNDACECSETECRTFKAR